MILADTSFWLSLTIAPHIFHDAAKSWIEKQSADRSILFCWSTEQSFLRLLTTAAVTRPYGIQPFDNSNAWKLYNVLRADPRVAFTAEPDAEKLTTMWQDFTDRRTASPKLWMDAYLAAFAIAGGHQLVTTDKAFGQFNGLNLILLASTTA